MEGFTAKSDSEEWIVKRDGRELRKLVTKKVKSPEFERESCQDILTVYKNGLRTLEAFFAEKENARMKRFAITSFGDEKEPPVLKEDFEEATRKRKQKILGRFVDGE